MSGGQHLAMARLVVHCGRCQGSSAGHGKVEKLVATLPSSSAQTGTDTARLRSGLGSASFILLDTCVSFGELFFRYPELLISINVPYEKCFHHKAFSGLMD